MNKLVIKFFIVFSVLSFSVTTVFGAVKNEPEKVVLKQNFQNVDIKVVIEAISKLTGRNFIVDPRVKGKVTLIAPDAMSPESLNETLMSILRVHGYVAIPGETATSIVPANLARDRIPYKDTKGFGERESWVSEVIRVESVPATKLVAVLRPLVAREGHLVALQESNSLIVTDTIKNIARIKKIIRKIDINKKVGYDVVKIKHGSVEDLVNMVKSVMPKPASAEDVVKINFDNRTNTIVLSGSSEKKAAIVGLISMLDVPVDQAEGGVQIVYLRYAKAKELVPVLQKISTNRSLLNSSLSTEGQAGKPLAQVDAKDLKNSISIEADERMNAIVISAPSQVITALKSVIKQLDIRRAQVLIEAILVEVSESKQAELGVEWVANGPNGVGMIDFSGTIPALLGSASNPAAAAAALGSGASMAVGQIGANNQGWGALIRALNADSRANILATPTILTLDNEKAEIVVGREVPFQTGSYTGTSGGTTPSNPFNTIERKDVGLKLKVKPQINEGNEVFLEIEQEVSDVLPKGDAVDLQTTKRQIKTKIIVADGHMIVLGGLLNERETEVEKKMPVLGDLPLLGALFTSKQNVREKVNLMVFLRPVIVRDNTMSSYYSNKKYRLIRQDEQNLLENDMGLLEGLRPHLPSIEQWKDSIPATPYVTKKERAEIEAEKQRQLEIEAAKKAPKVNSGYDYENDILDL